MSDETKEKPAKTTEDKLVKLKKKVKFLEIRNRCQEEAIEKMSDGLLNHKSIIEDLAESRKYQREINWQVFGIIIVLSVMSFCLYKMITSTSEA